MISGNANVMVKENPCFFYSASLSIILVAAVSSGLFWDVGYYSTIIYSDFTFSLQTTEMDCVLLMKLCTSENTKKRAILNKLASQWVNKILFEVFMPGE